MILTDNETKVDLLNNGAIAATIIGLLRSKPDHPVTIGVHGDWGAGKSSVLEMIEAGFADQDDVLCLKFNGWRFQGFEDAKIALIEGGITGFLKVSVEELLIALRDDLHLLNEPAALLSGSCGVDEAREADGSESGWSLYPDGFSAERFAGSLRRGLCGMCRPRRVEVALCSRRTPRKLRVASSALSGTQSCCNFTADGSCL